MFDNCCALSRRCARCCAFLTVRFRVLGRRDSSNCGLRLFDYGKNQEVAGFKIWSWCSTLVFHSRRCEPVCLHFRIILCVFGCRRPFARIGCARVSRQIILGRRVLVATDNYQLGAHLSHDRWFQVRCAVLTSFHSPYNHVIVAGWQRQTTFTTFYSFQPLGFRVRFFTGARWEIIRLFL